MLKEEGLLDEEAEKEIISGYDFTTLTGNDKSVVKFKDMDHNIINKIKKYKKFVMIFKTVSVYLRNGAMLS